MYFAHWQLQVLLYDKCDSAAAIELAVRCTAEMRKAIYTHLPERLSLYEDLVCAYIYGDPAGNAPQIEQALKDLTAEASAILGSFPNLYFLWMEFKIKIAQWDEALTWGMRGLEHCQTIADATNRAHGTAACYCQLCRIAYAQSDWKALSEWATAGEQVAILPHCVAALFHLLTWQAVALRQRGDDNAARRTSLRATAMADRAPGIIGPAYYDAVSAYHELGGELETAYRMRGRELAGLTGRGRVADECHCHLERCRLLKLMGQPFDQELTAAREAAARLKAPEPFLSNLVRVISDKIPSH